LHCIGVHRDQKSLPKVLDMLKVDSWQNRRAAAEAAGRIGDPSAVPVLLEALGDPCDRVLEHSLIYALIEIGNLQTTAAGLRSSKPQVRRAALIALDQMPNGSLKPETVAAELTSSNPRMKETAWWIASRHPEWGGTVAGFLRDRLNAKTLLKAEQDELVQYLAKFARGGPVQTLLGDQLSDTSSTADARRTVLRAMAESGVKQLPPEWVPGLTRILGGDDAELVQQAISTARQWRNPKQKSQQLAVPLLAAANNSKLPASVRLSALAAVPAGQAELQPIQFDLVLAHLGADQPLAARSAAADALSRAKLNNEQKRSLISALKSIGPMELDRALEALTASPDDAIGKELIDALSAGSSKSGLRAEMLKPRLAKFSAAVREQAEKLYATLNVDAGKQQAHLEKLMQASANGDKSRGQVVFNSQKAACFSCHAIGYLGGNIGPDLTHIARTRTDRDLLEAVVFPSASFVRGYEPILVTTKSGKVVNGVLRNDVPEEVVLATGSNQFERIPREDIDEMRPSLVSVMPAGFDQALTPAELADLLAFLKACK
jgi:putative heme-binding domain-containing protein